MAKQNFFDFPSGARVAVREVKYVSNPAKGGQAWMGV
jgi:hypothetical protein